MFYGCSSLSTLDLSKFNTSDVQYMSSVFDGCSKLNDVKYDKNDSKLDYVLEFYGISRGKYIEPTLCLGDIFDDL